VEVDTTSVEKRCGWDSHATHADNTPIKVGRSWPAAV